MGVHLQTLVRLWYLKNPNTTLQNLAESSQQLHAEQAPIDTANELPTEFSPQTPADPADTREADKKKVSLSSGWVFFN